MTHQRPRSLNHAIVVDRAEKRASQRDRLAVDEGEHDEGAHWTEPWVVVIRKQHKRVL